MKLQRMHRRRRRRYTGQPFVMPTTGTGVGAIVQPKLRVSRPGDTLEKEADTVANRVMSGQSSGPVQAGEPAAHRQCAECEAGKKEEEIQPKRTDAPGAGADQPVGASLTERIQNRRGGGHSLPRSERRFFEPRFGRSLSGVRVHTDGEAQQLSESIRARAFTVGRDIFFNRGEYRPGEFDGRRLMAHELTHTLQQGDRGSTVHREEKGAEPYQYGVDGFRFEPFGETCEPATVDDAVVQGHIDRLMNASNGDPTSAFSDMRTERENHCCDVNRASAEHYLYARSQVQSGETSYATMVALIGLYSGKKVVPDALIPRTGDCPPTPASEAQTTWGLRGAEDGEANRSE